MKTTSIILTTIIAGVGGMLAGTLFAPRKGSKTRRKIAKKGHEYSDYVIDNLNDVSNSIAHPFEGAEDQTIRLSEKAIDKAKKMKENISNKIN